MIRCSCGEFHGNACMQAEHKKYQKHPSEHKVVCSHCGEEFTSYPLPEKGVHVAFANEEIVWTLCDKCMADKQSVSTTTVDKIIDFEDGQMTEVELINFFQDLIDNGMAWSLQGMYGRMAMSLIENGWCFKELQWKGEFNHG